LLCGVLCDCTDRYIDIEKADLSVFSDGMRLAEERGSGDRMMDKHWTVEDATN
jgi:hypothetical protein